MDVTIDKLELTDERHVAVAHIRLGNEPREVRWTCNSQPLSNLQDAAFVNLLLPAMAQGGKFIVNGEVSAVLLQTADQIMDICHGWWPQMQKVSIENAVPVPRKPTADGRVGSFFSAGVDSFYTLLECMDEIDDLILIHGFDLPTDQHQVWNEVSNAVRLIAEAYGKQVIEVTTDACALHQTLGVYSQCQSATLASVALALAPRFQKVYIPSSIAYKDLVALGSHPLLDPLWATEQTEFIHHGCETNRLEKVRRISCDDMALRYLRSCFMGRKPDAVYCCGCCEKCLRTMAELYAVGALDRCPAFPHKLDLRRYSTLRLDRIKRPPHLEVLRALEVEGKGQKLQKAIRRALKQPDEWTDLMVALEDPKTLVASTWRGVRRRAGDVLHGNWRKAFASWSK